MSTERLSDEQARGMLADAAHALAEVLHQVRRALERVNRDDADAVHAARVAAEFKDVQQFGVREEKKAVRLHPLFAMWQLASRTGAAIERMIAVTNPKLYAERKVMELRAIKQAKQAVA